MMASLAGAVTDTYEYDAFGNMLAKTGATPNAYLYRGERYDADLKLYYLRARWYNPVTGRFMTRDPYSGSAYDPASLHRYNYARSNPSNFLDPSGRATLGEYALSFTNQAAKNVAVGAVGLSVACMIRADAGILYLVGEFSHDNQTVIDAKADFTNCLASITVEQLTEATLLGWGFGVVFEELGGMLREFLQGAEPEPLLSDCCFAAGTPVHTDHGAVPIERIRVGDKVWSLNRTTGKQELKTVTALTAQHRDRLIELRIEGEAAPLRPSLDHPFWVRRASAGHEAWIEAGAMLVGDLVLDRGGNWHKVLAVKPLEGLQTVYNFEVDGDHDYYVGKSGLLVHNALCDLATRVRQLQNELDPYAQSRRTTAGMETLGGPRVLAGGGTDLSAAQQALLQDGETAAALNDAHAETTLLNHAVENGQLPTLMESSRPFCDDCTEMLQQSGAQIGPNGQTAIWSLQ